jgi:hypothetical protein
MPQKQLDVHKSLKGEIGCESCLFSLSARQSYANVGILNHTYIIATISNSGYPITLSTLALLE